MSIAKIFNMISVQQQESVGRDASRGFLSTAFQRRSAYRHHPGGGGVDPTRFGDWEYNGRCTDFS